MYFFRKTVDGVIHTGVPVRDIATASGHGTPRYSLRYAAGVAYPRPDREEWAAIDDGLTPMATPVRNEWYEIDYGIPDDVVECLVGAGWRFVGTAESAWPIYVTELGEPYCYDCDVLIARDRGIIYTCHKCGRHYRDGASATTARWATYIDAPRALGASLAKRVREVIDTGRAIARFLLDEWA
jgi:ribosomal protein L37AE/L43A